jgi:hypothetical protein
VIAELLSDVFGVALACGFAAVVVLAIGILWKTYKEL